MNTGNYIVYTGMIPFKVTWRLKYEIPLYMYIWDSMVVLKMDQVY